MNIGGVSITLENLFDNYREFEKIVENKTENDEIDLSDLELNPTTILPLLSVSKKENLIFSCENSYDYLLNVLKGDELFSQLPKSRIESDSSDFISGYMDKLDSDYGSYFALRHIISELTNNVYDHAKPNSHDLNSYIFSKLDNNLKKLDICVIDDGLSIPGLFELANVNFKNDCHALEKAIGAFSTVSDTFYERGNGLRTIVRLVVEGNGGELLLVSRNGLLHINNEKYKYYLLNDEHKFNGTLVALSKT